MKRRPKIALDFEIDKLTNSIQNTISGDSFQGKPLTDTQRKTISEFIKADKEKIAKQKLRKEKTANSKKLDTA